VPLKLPDKWLWDFWFAQDDPNTHIFYLQASRALSNPDRRHWHVSVGHAVSKDLQTWTVLPDALRPSPSPAWDDYTTWTGSVIKRDGLWYLFYTGSSRKEKGLVQRIGVATSADLLKWKKHPGNPLIEADPQWYELLDLNLWHDQAWRDPWIFQHPTTGDFHAFITARINYGPADGRGVVAQARSSDLIQWEVLPPVCEPGDFGQLEVPQLVKIKGRYYLLFCTSIKTHAAQWTQRTGLTPVTGTHYLVADDPLGPYQLSTNEFFAGDAAGSLYSGKLIRGAGGEWFFMAFRNFDKNGEFLGEIIDPLPVKIDNTGNLMIGF